MSKMDRFRKEYLGRGIVTASGFFIIALTLAIGAFLIVQGTGTFTKYHHSILEFLFSSEWAPVDSVAGGTGKVGCAIYIAGSLMTCGLALLMVTPFAVGAAVFMTEIAPKAGTKIFQPAIEMFVGIPSVVYGWIGLTVLVPFIRDTFHARMGGYSVLAASIVLAIMIFPTITTVAADSSVLPESRIRTWLYQMAGHLPDRSSGSQIRHSDRDYSGTCESVRRGTCGCNGHRKNKSVPEEHPFSDQ